MVITPVLTVISLLQPQPVFSQSCPLNAGEYKLNTQNAAESNKVKQTSSGGVTYNQLWCPYTAPGQPSISVHVNWITTVPNNKFKYNWTCMSIVSSKDVINLENKQAYATFGGYAVNDEYRRGLMRPVAEKLLQEIYTQAVPCPHVVNPGDPVDPDRNAEACRKNFEKLRQLREKKSGISQQLIELQGTTYNEAASREKLSKFNKFAVMIQDTNYGIFPNWYPAELDQLIYDRYHRSRVAIEYGIHPDAPALEVIRAVRDITANRIEYFKKAPGYIQQYKKELVGIEKEMEALHRENTQRQCRGDYDINSCDLSGDWVMTRWDVDPDNGTYDETWRFTPVSKGRYSAQNIQTGFTGEAETFGHRVSFRVKTGAGNTILHTYLLNDICEEGGGNSNIHVASPRMTIRRADRSVITYVNDKLYSILFRGKNYQSIYQRELHNGAPIDVFFFRINLQSGYQAEQHGEKLWGKFVRNPSTSHNDQSAVQWWFSNWVMESGKWVKKDELLTSAPEIK